MEVLVAITLFSLIVVLLSSSFYFADKSRSVSIEKVDEIENKRLAQRIFKQYLETARPVWQQQDSEKSLLFSGTDKELAFVSAMPAHLGDAGLYTIRLSITGENNKKQLIFDRKLLHPDLYESQKNELNVDTILLDDKQELEFSYYGFVDEEENADWYADWPSNNHLPDLVRLTIRDTSGTSTVMQIRMSARISAFTPVIQDYPSISQDISKRRFDG